MFRIAEGTQRTIWCSTNGSSTYYVGQIVSILQATKAAVTGGTVVPMVAANGVADTSGFQIPFGIIVGTNNAIPTNTAIDSTGTSTQTTAGVLTQALQTARVTSPGTVLTEGNMYGSDIQPLVEVALIDQTTWITGPVFNNAYGTAPTAVASSTDANDGVGWTTAGTTAACDFTPVANKCTIYCRTGANAGLYRVTSDTSTTEPAVTVAFPYDPAAGDTFVRVPFKQGFSSIYIGGTTPSLYVDCSLGLITNTFEVIVLDMDLRTAGQETVTLDLHPVILMQRELKKGGI